MSDLELVQWTVELAEADLVMIEVLDIVCAEANVRDAWNTWWAKRVDVAGAPFVQLVFGRYTELFDSNVVLAAMYAIGGGCSSLDGARVILPHLAKALGVEEASQSVHFATDVLQKFADASAHILIDELQGLSEGQVCGVVGAGLAQIRALELLALFGLVTDLPAIVACQGRVEDQRRVLIRLLASAQRSAITESVSLWETVLSLHSLDLFSCLSVDDLKQEYLRSLLNNEEFDPGARSY
ncbi:hypothetical protein DL89DRAFT_98156 [Linderina pennispora]|uniref:Uncharacterized protein n=1 Tax=Linderina pennispora TaxID=61395 RepID=A0A1Y1VWL7_9FUNG|nr:uncharacterized protein DL89DRAFT_98156 [Linderina pennispora]ORX65682.1 hypothetical protein DL89DRAFT_98156 [Linderina pennispora]